MIKSVDGKFRRTLSMYLIQQVTLNSKGQLWSHVSEWRDKSMLANIDWSVINYNKITLDGQLSKVPLLKTCFSISISLSNLVFDSNKTTAKVATSNSPYWSEALKTK